MPFYNLPSLDVQCPINLGFHPIVIHVLDQMQHIYNVQWQNLDAISWAMPNLDQSFFHINHCTYLDEKIQSQQDVIVICINYHESHHALYIAYPHK